MNTLPPDYGDLRTMWRLKSNPKSERWFLTDKDRENGFISTIAERIGDNTQRHNTRVVLEFDQVDFFPEPKLKKVRRR